MAYSTPDNLLLARLLTIALPIPLILYFVISFTKSQTRPGPSLNTPRQSRIKLFLALASLFYLLHEVILSISIGIPLLEKPIKAPSTVLVERYLHSTSTLFRLVALALLFPALGGEGWSVCLPPSWRRESAMLASWWIRWIWISLLISLVLMGGMGVFFVNVETLADLGRTMRILAEVGALIGAVGLTCVLLSGLVVGVVRERRRKERVRRSLEGVGMRVNPARVSAGDAFAQEQRDERGVGREGGGTAGGRSHGRVVSTISVDTTQTFSVPQEEVEHDEEIGGMDRWLRKRKRHMLLRIAMPAVMLVTVLYVGEAAGGGVVTKEGIVKEAFGFMGWCLVLLGFRMGLG